MKKRCPECDTEMVEVRKAEYSPGSNRFSNEYPKELGDFVRGKMYNEYRFACPRCKKEWIYDSLWRRFEYIDKKSQFIYSWEKGYLVVRYPKKWPQAQK